MKQVLSSPGVNNVVSTSIFSTQGQLPVSFCRGLVVFLPCFRLQFGLFCCWCFNIGTKDCLMQFQRQHYNAELNNSYLEREKNSRTEGEGSLGIEHLHSEVHYWGKVKTKIICKAPCISKSIQRGYRLLFPFTYTLLKPCLHQTPAMPVYSHDQPPLSWQGSVIINHYELPGY